MTLEMKMAMKLKFSHFWALLPAYIILKINIKTATLANMSS
jgi:hypothetical protein